MSQLGDTVRIIGVAAFVALGCLAAVPLARVPVEGPALPAGARSRHELPVTPQARVGVPAAGDFSTAERLGR